jgi:hypothetical protein
LGYSLGGAIDRDTTYGVAHGQQNMEFAGNCSLSRLEARDSAPDYACGCTVHTNDNTGLSIAMWGEPSYYS